MRVCCLRTVWCVTDSMTSSNVSEKASWFVGKMERGQAEQFLMEVRDTGGELNYTEWEIMLQPSD